MSWAPLTEASLSDLIHAAQRRMTAAQGRLWEAIRMPPQKWKQTPYGDEGGGFWVVAVIGSRVVWYNDIEEGFNWSHYTVPGEIGEYWCNQDDLEHAVQRLLDEIDGASAGYQLGPPQ